MVGEYKAKGNYIDLDGMQVCTVVFSQRHDYWLTYQPDTTGPSGATSAIFIVYDIFGFSPQALQGADILAHADKSHQYQVFMPDFFYGKPLPLSVFPPDTDEKKKQMGDFFSGPAAPPPNAEKVPELVKKLGQRYTGIQKWGSLGMCWGGKVYHPHE